MGAATQLKNREGLLFVFETCRKPRTCLKALALGTSFTWSETMANGYGPGRFIAFFAMEDQGTRSSCVSVVAGVTKTQYTFRQPDTREIVYLPGHPIMAL